MNTNKKRTTINPHHEHLPSQDITDVDNDILSEIYKQIQDMYKMRLIQKLARPIDVRTKQSYAQTFYQILESTHNKIARFRANLIQKLNYEQVVRDKSIQQEHTNRNTNLKKKIRTIESRYNEVFFEGSMKHYPKVRQTFNLNTELQPIQIVDWGNDCVERLSGISQACC